MGTLKLKSTINLREKFMFITHMLFELCNYEASALKIMYLPSTKSSFFFACSVILSQHHVSEKSIYPLGKA